MKSTRRTLVLAVIVGACMLLAIGALAVIAGQQVRERSAQQERIGKLEADVRTYAGRYLDLQESRDEEREAIESAASVTAYELAECRKAKK